MLESMQYKKDLFIFHPGGIHLQLKFYLSFLISFFLLLDFVFFEGIFYEKNDQFCYVTLYC